jgi:hypothetical protein
LLDDQDERSEAIGDESMFSGNGFIQKSGRNDVDGATYTSGRQR